MADIPSNDEPTVTLGDKTYRVRIPRSFVDREDIITGWGAAKDSASTRRIFGATLALCVFELAAMARPHTLESCDDRLARYGKHAYDAIRGRGVTPAEISAAATVCYKAILLDLYPRENEVAAAEDFSKAEAPPT